MYPLKRWEREGERKDGEGGRGGGRGEGGGEEMAQVRDEEKREKE